MNDPPLTSEADSYEIMDRALEHGINFFDKFLRIATADRKARVRRRRIVGRWFAQGGGRREKVVLATKA